MRRVHLVGSLLFLLAACSGQVPKLTATPDTTAAVQPSLTTTTVVTTTEALVIPPELAGFDVRPLSIQDGELTYLLTVAVADSAAERAQGLMGLADLGDLDGMLFVWPDLTSSTFWMKDTLLPLDIAFFAPDGSWVDNFTMAPCAAGDECENYSAASPYIYAIEVPDAGFATLTPAAQLVLDP